MPAENDSPEPKAKAPSQKQGVPEYRRIVSLLGETRDSVLARFRTNGGSPDRWSRTDWLAMAEALSRAEDALELRFLRQRRKQTGLLALRLSLRDARRTLETAS